MSLIRNTAYNLLGNISPVLVALVTVPLYLKYIGVAEYGILTIAWLFMGYSMYAEFGLGQGVANEIARLENGKIAERNAIFWTGFLTALTLGFMASVVIIGLGFALIPTWSSLGSKLQTELMHALPWLLLAAPLSTGYTVMASTIESRQQFKQVNVIQSVGWALAQGLPLITVFLGDKTLPWLVGLAVLGRVVTFAALFFALSGILPLAGGIIFRRDKLFFLLSFGGWVTANNIAETLLGSLDRWFAGAFLGAKGVAYYAVPANLAQRTTVLPAAIVRTLFPRYSAMHPEAALPEAVRITVYQGRILAPLIGFGIILVGPFLRLWVGSDFTSYAYAVAPLLLFTAWMRAHAYIPDVMLRATRRPRTVAWVRILELPGLFVICWLGFKWLGLAGLAWAWCLRVTFDAAWLWGRTGRLTEVAANLLPQIAGLGVIYILMRGNYPSFSIAAAAGSGCVVILLMAGTFWLDRHMWARFWLMLQRRIRTNG